MTTMVRTLEVLERAECAQLLRTRTVGRLALNRRGFGPLVVPVVYAVDDGGGIVFRTDVGTKLARITRGAVTFQVDEIDDLHQTGWSVMVEGLAHEIDGDAAVAGALHPWLPGRLAHAVRIVPSVMTGRRLREADD